MPPKGPSGPFFHGRGRPTTHPGKIAAPTRHPIALTTPLPSPAVSPAQLRRGLIAIFASTFCELSGLFMFFPLLLFTAKGLGLNDALVGLLAATNWLGLAVATPFAGGWVARLGMRGALLLSGAVPLGTLTLTVLTPWPVGWALLGVVGGAAGSLRWIVAEATVAELAPAARRGRIVGLYETMVGCTFVLGPSLLAFIGTEGAAAQLARWTAVALSALGLLLSFAVPALTSHHREDAPPPGWRGIAAAMRQRPVLMLAGAVGGFFEAGTSGLLPLYGLSAGFGAGMAALLVSASGAGSALVMVPVGELADRWSLRGVLLGCAAITLGACLLLPLAPAWPPLAYVIAFVWGGAGGALYTLAMVDIGHREQGVALVNTTAVLVLSYTLGGMAAPMLGGLALSLAPGWGMPLLMIAVAGTGLAALLKAPAASI